jgi:hypothetical protein
VNKILAQVAMMPIDNKKLAVIHIVKKELGLIDDEYRDILERETGVRSAKNLNEQGFRRLMRYFTRSRHYRDNRDGITFRQKLYIKYLARDLDWDQRHLTNWMHKYYKKQKVEQLNKKEASKVIVALKNILEHARKRIRS